YFSYHPTINAENMSVVLIRHHFSSPHQKTIMKKRILLFTSSSILLAGMIMSHNTGPITNLAGNRTGSQGSVANCSSGAGCHAPNNPNTTDTVLFFNPANNFGVTSWEPGETYKVTLLVTTTNSTLG